MAGTLKKIEKYWTIVITRDGITNDYRFITKRAAIAWAKRVGIEI